MEWLHVAGCTIGITSYAARRMAHADGALVGFEFLDLEAPSFPRVLERVKARFSAAAPALGSVEAVSACVQSQASSPSHHPGRQ